MNILITGADGIIGSHLVDYLINKNNKITALSYYNSFNNLEWLNGKKNKNLKSFYWVGGVSGLSSVFIGATGPLIAPFFLNHQLTKENIISNKAACQVISHFGKIPLFIYFFNVSYINQSQILLPLIVAVFIGTNFGKYILRFIPEVLFQKLFRYTLIIIAIKLILNVF